MIRRQLTALEDRSPQINLCALKVNSYIAVISGQPARVFWSWLGCLTRHLLLLVCRQCRTPAMGLDTDSNRHLIELPTRLTSFILVPMDDATW